ncbi:hypothetical protein [Brevibacillus formosus]
MELDINQGVFVIARKTFGGAAAGAERERGSQILTNGFVLAAS